MIDFSKPVETKSGYKVVILATDTNVRYGNMTFPVVGLVTDNNGKQTVETWTIEGRFQFDGGESKYDLVNVPDSLIVYLNIDADGYIGGYKSRADADASAFPDRIACVKQTVQFTVGQFDE